MQNNNSNYNLKQSASACGRQNLQKGRKVIYEGDAAYIITVKPVLVVKTKDRVVCGAIRENLSV